MTMTDRSHRRRPSRGTASVVASLIALSALLVPLLADSSASATSLRNGSVSAATTCPTDPYTGSTVATCGTTTTTSGITIVITLTISYLNGVVKWQACGFPPQAVGTTVQLYLGGQLITISGGTGVVLSGGCTADPSFPICLVPGNYPAVAVDHFGQASNAMPVVLSGCLDPISLAVGSNPQGTAGTGTGTGTTSSGGALAFTGTNVLVLLLIAALLIVLGYAIVRLNRQRRRAG